MVPVDVGWVLLEMNFFSQYEGDATFDALHAEMTGLGFTSVNVSPPLTKRRRHGRPTWTAATAASTRL